MFLKRALFKAISFKNLIKLPVSYWLLLIIRFALTIVPQNGYIHPDEFFQSIEVVAGDILDVDVIRTWEFNPKFPIRNIFVPKMVLGPPLHFIRIVNPYTMYYLNIDLKTPYYLLVIPRLFICLLSLINDYCLYRICILYGQNFRTRLKLFASSYVALVYCCRSFSNTFEMILFSLLLLFVAKCMRNSNKYKPITSSIERVKLSHLPEHSLNCNRILSSVVVIGIFNRPTFVGFAFAPVIFWLLKELEFKIVKLKDFTHRIFIFIMCGIPTGMLLIIVDSVYYGHITMADVESLKFSWGSWVVTPLNFILYNIDTKNLTQHGLHPWWLHLVVNVPLLFNVLGVLALVSITGNTYRFIRGQYNKLPRIQSITGLMLFSLVTPVAVLSLFPHQEATFIIPVLIPLIYLYGNHLHPNETDGAKSRRLKNILRICWYCLNVLCTIFFGFIHQGGIYPFSNSFYREIKSNHGIHTHVVTSHIYTIPAFLLQLENKTPIWIEDRKTKDKYRLASTTFLYNQGSIPLDELFIKIDDVLTNAEMLLHKDRQQYKFYIASPCSLEKKFHDAASNHYVDLTEEFLYYPHLSMEAFPEFPSDHDQSCVKTSPRMDEFSINLNIFQRVSCFFNKLCLKIYRIRPSGKFKN